MIVTFFTSFTTKSCNGGYKIPCTFNILWADNVSW